jgi:hypothetical protein
MLAVPGDIMVPFPMLPFPGSELKRVEYESLMQAQRLYRTA